MHKSQRVYLKPVQLRRQQVLHEEGRVLGHLHSAHEAEESKLRTTEQVPSRAQVRRIQ